MPAYRSPRLAIKHLIVCPLVGRLKDLPIFWTNHHRPIWSRAMAGLTGPDTALYRQVYGALQTYVSKSAKAELLLDQSLCDM